MLSQNIFDFNTTTAATDWIVTDDVVMGGKSAGSFTISKEGHGVFEGNVSLENNGGFSSVRHKLQKTKVSHFSTVILKVKGDGKKYQFRVKASSTDYYSYIAVFGTTGEWQKIEIPLKNMYPAFRGKKLDMPNYDKNTIEEIAFLIANKKPENFTLLVDAITLK